MRLITSALMIVVLLAVQQLKAQQKLQGTVTDRIRQTPLSGISVQVKGFVGQSRIT
jgi:hypothetical protein